MSTNNPFAKASVAMIFAGEKMECVLCPAKEMSDPAISSSWRAVELNGERFYGCPAHFPDDYSPIAAYTRAYMTFLDKVVEKLKAKSQ